MGYTGELGYHHLLYGGANESQKLLLWLNENLPSLEKSDETAEKTGLGTPSDANFMEVTAPFSRFVSRQIGQGMV